MKKIQIMLAIGMIIFMATTKVTAQLAVNTVSRNETEISSTDDEGNTLGYKSLAKLSKASFRASNNFKRSFKDQPDAKWSVETKVMVATFSKDDINTKAVYDRKGRWLWTMQTYHENKMPADIRSLVKRSIYFDYNITLVQQVEQGDLTVYIINLKNDKKLKQISVYDGEINVLQDFDRSE